MLKVYCSTVPKKVDDEKFKRYLTEMPGDIRRRIEKFVFPRDAYTCLFGKLLLKKALRELSLDNDLTRIKYSRYNRPYIEGSIDFNISHSGDHVVCALCDDGSIGVDIEEIQTVALEDFKNHFSPDEWSHITRASDYKTFYQYWTKKEAVAKMLGMGLNIALRDIIIEGNLAHVNQETIFLKPIILWSGSCAHLASRRELFDFTIEEIKF